MVARDSVFVLRWKICIGRQVWEVVMLPGDHISQGCRSLVIVTAEKKTGNYSSNNGWSIYSDGLTSTNFLKILYRQIPNSTLRRIPDNELPLEEVYASGIRLPVARSYRRFITSNFGSVISS